MRLFVGLGNPTDEYKFTRHNIGFLTIDRIKEKYNFPEFRTFGKGLISSSNVNSDKIILLKPQTWMNSSGESIFEIVSYFKIPEENIIVFYDEMALPTGKVRIANKGSSAGHNGIKSIQEYYDNFVRFRIGIDHPNEKHLVRDYVLGNFTEREKELLETAIPDDILDMVLSKDYQKIMSYNSELIKKHIA